jgi:SAM-dependent methyltransferase
VARRIYFNKPILHVDVGSRVAGFVSHVASFRPIEVLDIRRITSKVADIKFTQCDLMNDIPNELVDYCDSLSCLHALEHFGLGRYGDPVRFDGYLAGLDNLHKILKNGGKLYFSVPIGPQRVEFDSHRVFAVKYLLDILHEKYAIDAFSYVDDNGDLFENAALTEQNVEQNFGCSFGCGIFEMTKR